MPASGLLLICMAVGQFLGPRPKRPADLDLFRVSTAVVERVAGRDCLAKRDYDGAIRHFDRSLQEQPDDAPTLIDRAKAWAEKKDGDGGREFADLSRAIELDPKNATARARRAAIRRDEADDARVDADLAEAFRLDPSNVEAHAARAYCLLARDDWDQGLADLNSAIDGGLRDADVYSLRATVRLYRHDSVGALADLDEAARIKPPEATEAAMSIWERCLARLIAGQYDRALGELDALLKLTPGTTDWLAFRAKTLEALGRTPEARATWDDLIRANPKNVGFLQSRAILHRQEGNYAAALADVEAALRVQPTYAALLLTRGGIEARQHRYVRVLTDYQSVVAWDPTFVTIADRANALAAIAWTCGTCPDAGVRDGARAIEAGTRACELTEWKDAYALTSLAAAHAEAGHFDRAIELAEAALKVPDPNPVTKQVDRTSGRFGITYLFPPTKQAEVRRIRERALAGYRNHQPYRDDR